MDVRGWLCELVPDGLWRTERLEKDLSHLDKAHALHLNDIKARGEATEKFVRHIRTAIQDKPHRLVAYSWVMYMAIFSGGRWIRQQLLDAQADFWHGQAESSRAWRVDSPLRSRAESGRITKTGMPGFSFLYFDSEADGEDIKADFKERLAAAEALLTPAERKDVVEEAQTIFEYCVSVVEELDRRLDTASGLGNQEPADGHAVRGKRPTSHPVQLTKRRIVDWQTRALQPLAALLAVFVGCLTWYVLL
ncbi:hypothetical protein H2203_003068 [Taxawa tesnikishii (nom. ined.)]|nr:hypothetical protein H2203_003068 [Dothideales sp. JES 119]